jgi:hypothetical protein
LKGLNTEDTEDTESAEKRRRGEAAEGEKEWYTSERGP